jgi:hypothetical protein
MLAFASSLPAPGRDVDLDEARESLEYWERRARRLPLYAVRGRREAHDMAARWRRRVAEAERGVYGTGLAGALALLVFERRLPETTRATGRRLARRGAQVAIALAVVLLVAFVAVMVAAAEVLAALAGALT